MKALKTTTLEVEGMTCGSCVRHVGDALRSVPGVASVEVNLREALAVVRHDDGVAPVERLIAALEAEGYPTHSESGA